MKKRRNGTNLLIFVLLIAVTMCVVTACSSRKAESAGSIPVQKENTT